MTQPTLDAHLTFDIARQFRSIAVKTVKETLGNVRASVCGSTPISEADVPVMMFDVFQ